MSFTRITITEKVIVRFPWKEDETDFDPEAAVEELSATALLTFREGGEYETTEVGSDGQPIFIRRLRELPLRT